MAKPKKAPARRETVSVITYQIEKAAHVVGVFKTHAEAMRAVRTCWYDWILSWDFMEGDPEILERQKAIVQGLQHGLLLFEERGRKGCSADDSMDETWLDLVDAKTGQMLLAALITIRRVRVGYLGHPAPFELADIIIRPYVPRAHVPRPEDHGLDPSPPGKRDRVN